MPARPTSLCTVNWNGGKRRASAECARPGVGSGNGAGKRHTSWKKLDPDTSTSPSASTPIDPAGSHMKADETNALSPSEKKSGPSPRQGSPHRSAEHTCEHQ